ncbi:hypothetical protein WA158_002057 [Blastocystis sp. Blastoise]
MKQTLVFYCLFIAVACAWNIWPLPQKIEYSGESTVLSSEFEIKVEKESPILLKAVDRYIPIIGKGKEDKGLRVVTVSIEDDSDHLYLNTDASYHISIDGEKGEITAKTAFGAMYGLETLSQIVEDGVLDHSKVEIDDYPTWRHRGFMIDSGRRFIPMHTVKLLMDSMPYNKLNTLHWHLSDWARVAIESKIYPVLTASLTGLQAGFFTQEEVKEIIEYGRERGIRIIPEFDIPGHSMGWAPLHAVGMEFCDDKLQQLYDDPQNKTFTILTTYLKEVLALFPEPYVHLGCDETTYVGKCSVEAFAAFEKKVFNYVYHTLGKRPIAWEEVLFKKNSVIPESIVNGWYRHYSTEILTKGYDTIESRGGNFYLNHIDYKMENMWSDLLNLWPTSKREGDKPVTLELTEEQKELFGGEASMWTDNYCYALQCGAWTGAKPVAWQLYDPQYDALFEESMISIMYPRAIAAAGSFWHYDSNLLVNSTEYKTLYSAANLRLQKRNIFTCPEECYCDELTKCGKKYLDRV